MNLKLNDYFLPQGKIILTSNLSFVVKDNYKTERLRSNIHTSFLNSYISGFQTEPDIILQTVSNSTYIMSRNSYYSTPSTQNPSVNMSPPTKCSTWVQLLHTVILMLPGSANTSTAFDRGHGRAVSWPFTFIISTPLHNFLPVPLCWPKTMLLFSEKDRTTGWISERTTKTQNAHWAQLKPFPLQSSPLNSINNRLL